MISKPDLLPGGTHTDERGTIRFANGFNPERAGIKRFYTILHPDTYTIRAWQGHRDEHKYFYVVRGSFVIAGVKIDDWENPSADLQPVSFVMHATDSNVLHIPRGYANGFKALSNKSQFMVFSTMELQKSESDKIRYEAKRWMDWDAYEPLNR